MRPSPPFLAFSFLHSAFASARTLPVWAVFALGIGRKCHCSYKDTACDDGLHGSLRVDVWIFSANIRLRRS
jgi:hypothetical protein